jgi:hypothetical protein
MNSDNTKPLLILVLGGAALWVAFHFSSPKDATDTTIGAETAAPVDVPLPAGPGHTNVSAPPPPQPTPSPEAPLPPFGPHLREIGDCLKISNSLNDDAELKFSALEDSLRDELGELIANDLDWKNVHLTLPDGEKRRLRMEVEGTGEEASGLRLHYYGVDKEDLPVPLPLTDEQSMNPSEAFIASLENEGKVTLREEAHRGVYSKGAELYYTERNGALSELELSYQGKSVKCQDLQSATGSCNCF